MRNVVLKYGKVIITLLFGIAVWLFWSNLYWGHLLYQELLQMFLFDADYWHERMAVAGGFADYVAEFLTQFSYIRYLGAAVMAVLFMLIQRGVWKIAERDGASGKYYSLSFLPALLVWGAMCNEDMLLSLPIALLLVLMAIRCCQVIEQQRWKWLFSLLIIPVLYWLAGAVHFVFVVWLVFHIKKGWSVAVIGLLIALATPYIAGHYLHYPMQRLFLGLNYFRSPEVYPLLIPLSALSMAIMPWVMKMLPAMNKQAGAKSVGLGIVVFACGGLFVSMQMDNKREEVFQYHQLTCRNDWGRIIAMAEKESPTEPLAVSCLNLALGKTGQLTSRMFHFYQHGNQTLLPIYSPGFITPIVASEMSYHLGMINEAYRYAFEGIQGTLNYRKSARLYKRLAETSLLNGNYEVAERYLLALQKTIYYRKWATRTMEYVRKPELIAQHPEWKRLLQYRFKNDFLFSEHQMPAILLELFYTDSSNVLALEYLYAHLLLDHDFNTLLQYISLMNKAGYKQVPRSIQEALTHYWRENYDDYSGMPFRVSQDIAREMEEFAKIFNFAANKQELLEKRFGKTYWYYLYRISN